jgi:hypothetical protein
MRKKFPDVSPFTQIWFLEREKKVTLLESKVKLKASWFMYPSINTAFELAS